MNCIILLKEFLFLIIVAIEMEKTLFQLSLQQLQRE